MRFYNFLFFLAISIILIQSSSAATLSITNDTPADLDNGAFITLTAPQTFTNTTDPVGRTYNSSSNPASTLELNFNGTRVQWNTATNKDLSLITYNSGTDTLAYNISGVSGYVNVRAWMGAATTSYNFKINGSIDQTKISDGSGFLSFNYTWGSYSVEILPGVAPPVGPVGWNISGIVYDEALFPISGASVVFGSNSTTSNATGYYQFLNISNGSYSFNASKPLYLSNITLVTMAGLDIEQNFTLSLIPTYNLSGYVTLNDSTPIPGALVSYSGGSNTTLADGSYVIHGIYNGTYPFTASKSGYFSNVTNVTIAGANQTQNFTLAAMPIVSGVIYGSDGFRVPGAIVLLASGDPAAIVNSTTADSNGEYSIITSISSGFISASKQGYISNSTSTFSLPSTTANLTLNRVNLQIPISLNESSGAIQGFLGAIIGVLIISYINTKRGNN
jgi:hypothetical protein